MKNNKPNKLTTIVIKKSILKKKCMNIAIKVNNGIDSRYNSNRFELSLLLNTSFLKKKPYPIDEKKIKNKYR